MNADLPAILNESQVMSTCFFNQNIAKRMVSSPVKSRSLIELSKAKAKEAHLGLAVVLSHNFFFFTSTSLFVQKFIARGTVTLVTNSPVPADVGTATIVICTLIQAYRERREVGGKTEEGSGTEQEGWRQGERS